MNKYTEERIITLLRTLANEENWEIVKHVDEYGNVLWNDLLWKKAHHDPLYVAQDLLNEISE